MSPRLMIGPTSVRCATMQEPLCPCQQRVASRTRCSSGAISADPLWRSGNRPGYCSSCRDRARPCRELPADGHGMLVRSSVRLSRPESVQPPLVPCRPRLLSAIAECLPHIAERARRWSVLRASPDVWTVTTRRGVDVSTPDDRSYLSAMRHHARAAVPSPAARRVTYPLQQRCDLCRPLVAERQSTRLLQLLPRSSSTVSRASR